MGKEKLDKAFTEVLDRGDKAFVPYIMAGDGGLEQLDEQLTFLEESGATAVELGIAFSDPVADGPVIQEAGLRALKKGVSLRRVIDKLRETKAKRQLPIVLMTYVNPINAYGIEKFAEDCKDAGVDGLIIPDLPLEEEGLLSSSLEENEIALIRLAALTSTEERLEEIAKRTEGFLYAVTVTGTTGVRAAFQENLGNHLKALQEKCPVPVLAGFGVSTPEHVRSLSEHCSGVIVGSKIVDALHRGDRETIRELIGAAQISKQA